jgi:hypothetical protein
MGAPDDVLDEYKRYLARFDQAVGQEVEFGAYAKYKGRLVKKLRYDEFEAKWNEYNQVDVAYAEILERGDTINDVMVKILRERADELMLERKV